MSRLDDLTGRKFGKLTPIEYLKEHKKWLCRCDCGKEIKVYATNLKQGRTVTCGCTKEWYGDIVGKKFGRLTVKKNLGYDKNKKSTLYECECDCGKIKTVARKSLLRDKAKTLSCGCLHDELFSNNREKTGYIDNTYVSMLESKHIRSNNTSGYTGVTWCKLKQKWKSQIGFKNKNYHLGYHDDIQDAVNARKDAEENIHGKFLEWYYNCYNKEKD
ncbi:hypothetical protein HZI73_26300 (plasmid) [Vallitalea pronyensis]|uniref:AP2 domain-containing protein n=1 Tax=Vallitalea pronyensis TaxID=1348613 RepID=A0A8J8MQT5_9FIRM|nr:hypothetical protein [Vallitalea pronyensis]QUI25927.1 hypothetical protein HZI73_26300 [Vallitalea pronyensis]